MTGPRSRWDEQRAQKRRDSSAGMPTCLTCGKASVLDPCRACAPLAEGGVVEADDAPRFGES